MEFDQVFREYITPLTAVLIIVLNGIEIILILKGRNDLKIALFLIFVINLSISDLIVGILIVFAKIFTFLKKHHYKDSVALIISLEVVHNMERLSCLLSVFNLLAFTFTRMYAIRHPFLHRTKFTRKLANHIIFGIWIMSFAILVSYYCAFTFGVSKDVATRFEGLIYPVSTYCAIAIISYSYRIIYLEIRSGNKRNSVPENKNVAGHKDNRGENDTTHQQAERMNEKKMERRKLKKEERIKRIATASILAFGFCWFPISTIFFIESIGFTWHNAGMIRKCFYLLACWNSVINPILYIAFSHREVDINRLFCCNKAKSQRKDLQSIDTDRKMTIITENET